MIYILTVILLITFIILIRSKLRCKNHVWKFKKEYFFVEWTSLYHSQIFQCEKCKKTMGEYKTITDSEHDMIQREKKFKELVD